MTKRDKYIRAVEYAMEHDGCSWLEMGTTKDGTAICLVVGWEDGYDKEDGLFQKQEGDTLYTLCMKLAYNCDDLQCDYDADWYMPYGEDGDIVDTSTAITTTGAWRDEFDWWEQEASDLIKLINNGELKAE